MRDFICAANWKLNKSPREAVSFFKEFLPIVEKSNSQSKILFFVPAIDLWVSQEILRDTEIGFGPQNIYSKNDGAFTGENSASVSKEIGCTHALVGHSERRSLFFESDELIAEKVKTALEQNLHPVICLGESLEERKTGKTNEVIGRQLKAALSQVDPEQKVTLAYEPVWAIGTGEVATPELAEEAHSFLRSQMNELKGSAFSEKTSILYGGSVKPDNCENLAKMPNIDGFLVGGASLKVESFSQICTAQY